MKGFLSWSEVKRIFNLLDCTACSLLSSSSSSCGIFCSRDITHNQPRHPYMDDEIRSHTKNTITYLVLFMLEWNFTYQSVWKLIDIHGCLRTPLDVVVRSIHQVGYYSKLIIVQTGCCCSCRLKNGARGSSSLSELVNLLVGSSCWLETLPSPFLRTHSLALYKFSKTGQ